MANKISIKYTLNGMDCPGCANTIEKFCKKIDGVEIAEVNYSSATLKVEYNSTQAKPKLEVGIHGLGYSLIEIKKTPQQIINNVVPFEIHKTSINQKIKSKFRKDHHIFASERSNSLNSSIPLILPSLDKNEFSNNTLHEEKDSLHDNSKHKSLNNNEFKKNFLPIIITSILFLICYAIQIYSPKIAYPLFTAIAIFNLYPILKKVIQYFKVGFYFSVEFLMSVAVIGALFIHSAEEAAAVLILFKLGEALEGYTSRKASRGIEKLSSLIPEYTSLVLEKNQTKQIKVSEIMKNQTLLIKPGERFPADGILIEGETYVDESLLTGESVPVFKDVQQKIYAGSLNTETPVKIYTTQVGQDHSVAKLIQLVQEAQGTKSKTFRTIENFSKYYTPLILVIGILTAILPPLLGFGDWEHWIYKGLAILLIGCPCALIISTPSAIAAAISSASRMGILIKSAPALEILGKIKTMAFDKTGTLTEGKLKITNIISFSSSFSHEDILHMIVNLEKHSTHPLAKSILMHASDMSIKPYAVSNEKNIPGIGISAKIFINSKSEDVIISSAVYALKNNLVHENYISLIENLQKQGKTICILNIGNKSIGLIALQDKLKIGAKEALNNLKKLNINSIILTGDHYANAENIAKELNIKMQAELLPENKLSAIHKLAQNGLVAMVGDGINDAPALAAANVGIAMGEGTDVAVDSAQIVIANKNISSLVSGVKISRKALSLIWQNIFIALFLKFLFLYLTLIGHTTLWMAILADTGATVLVTLNSLRLLKVPKEN